MTIPEYHHYPKNTFFMSSDCNVTFDEVLKMSEDEFVQWVKDVRSTIVDIWDTHGTPPLNGYNRQEIIDQFNNMHGHPVHKMFVKDEITGDTCIRNTHNRLGNACNSWFPTMMKTRINYGSGEARSIYDYMARDDLLKNYLPYGRRHFKRDSFYAYSQCVKDGQALPTLAHEVPANAEDFIRKFHEMEKPYNKFDFWISEKEADKKYSGYNEDIINTKFYQLTYKQVVQLHADGCIEDYQLSNLKHKDDEYIYEIRLFEKGQKIFPVGLKSFRISVCQYAVQYPPIMAKAVYEKYTEHKKDQDVVHIWDPSSGWGGRLLGALSMKDDRNIKYLGCDPNTDHTIVKDPLYTKYDDLATFYNEETVRSRGIFPHTNDWQFWQCGSEEIQYDKEFQKYKGKIDFVFTSPPYFHREEYSEDDTQSCHKFSAYEDWRDCFLFETLKTAYEWMAPNSFIAWNIADIKEGKDFVPLEQDSHDIMVKLGFEYVETLKMVLGQMPGGNRTETDKDGNVTSTNKNSVKLNGSFYRYEPIMIYRKN